MNVTSAIHLANLCKKCGVKRYLFASSCSVYDSETTKDLNNKVYDESSQIAPRSVYAKSKLDAETQLLALTDQDFCPVLLRKGTIYGFSPRMRYDLVINKLLKDALTKRVMTLHNGGETWRPIIEIRDVANAYLACLQTNTSAVRGKTFNVVFADFRVSEIALRIRETIRQKIGLITDIQCDYTPRQHRSYRVSGKKLEQSLGFKPNLNIEQSVAFMIDEIKRRNITDFENPVYDNIRWLELQEKQTNLTSQP